MAWQGMPGGVTTQLATGECEEQLDLVRQRHSPNITEENRAIAAALTAIGYVTADMYFVITNF